MNRINYNLEMKKIIDSLDGKKPKLLLHSCCAPCSSAVLEKLKEIFDISIFYYNPNLDSKDEFIRRSDEQKRLAEELGIKKVIVEDYKPEDYYLKIKGHENDKEGGPRCFLCFELRLEKTAELAKKFDFDYFTTTLSISPYKNAQALNEIGEKLGKKHGVNYLYSDFKKENGYKRSIELSKLYKLYRQNYCGCEFSKKEAELRERDKSKIL
ncbi:epoxyqueuosine reductase QueH [Peptoniphilus catoniae]|uniref:epoxyqueuosine reductase QueH n=1 Tax=Peptoniphilus catoniae TaxID=1660341 RepID=UPI0010FEB1D7|nr:epoxyqueuosine reductase QueH [Peptoniphilus catoniae]